MDVHRSSGTTRTVLGVVGAHKVEKELIELLDGVHEVLRISEPYKRASRTFKPEDTIVTIDDVRIGGDEVIMMAGPCSAETEEQVMASAAAVRRAGAKILRGGAFKPRSSPYSFQGLGKKGLELLALARKETGLPVVTEALDEEGAHLVAEYADCIQIGARNMQNYALLKTIGKLGRPVLLKRGMAATIVDLLMSAEYLLAEGNTQVILCERGIQDGSIERLRPTKTRREIAVVAIAARNAIAHTLEIRLVVGSPNLRGCRGRSATRRMVRCVDDTAPVPQHQRSRRLNGLGGNRRLGGYTTVDLIQHATGHVVHFRRIGREMDIRVASRGYRLRLDRRRIRVGSRSDLERHDAAQIVVDLHDVDDENASIAGVQCEVAAIRRTAHAQKCAVHWPGHERHLHPHRSHSVGAHSANSAALAFHPPHCFARSSRQQRAVAIGEQETTRRRDSRRGSSGR